MSIVSLLWGWVIDVTTRQIVYNRLSFSLNFVNFFGPALSIRYRNQVYAFIAVKPEMLSSCPTCTMTPEFTLFEYVRATRLCRSTIGKRLGDFLLADVIGSGALGVSTPPSILMRAAVKLMDVNT